ncbi:alpha/beta fold hydrolase [Steroidobacter flavus]|uniref:Alpha/beta fold hydrolase n=1 Tax=Steroidobacter flavus TaxID=1842136 RepID=A0ABV8T0X6_9GAMM
MNHPLLKPIAAAVLALATTSPVFADQVSDPPSVVTTTENTVRYRTKRIDGVELFYREAGPANAPTIVLLHGFPTSSNMYRDLIPALAGKYRVIAPDYPGFGHSAVPPRDQFEYTFAHFADLTDRLLTELRADRYALYVMDYGAPVGYRLALKHPERVTALVVQNGNAYTEGLKEFWNPIKAYWASGSKADREALRGATTLAATREQYLDGVKDPSRVDPTTWLVDQALLDRPGNAEIQLDLFYDYRTNVELYPKFHEFFRNRQPPTLIVWGRNDKIFPAEGAQAYLRDLPKAELHLLDSGHFALEDRGQEIASLMLSFLNRHLSGR